MDIPWHPLSLSDRFKVAAALFMVKLGKLRYDQFSEQELNELLTPYFPQQMPIPVPIGKATLTLLEGELSMPESTNRLELQLLCALDIRVLGNPIYRAHLIVIVSADPTYDASSKIVSIENIQVDEVALVNDEYALLTDTTKLIDSLSPLQLSSLFTSPVKTALSVLTAGSSMTATAYLNLYIGGSKQRILEYHKPQIEQHVIDAVAEADLNFELDPAEWRQNLFARRGRTVSVEEKELRFYF
ncbi:DUF1439 domain-containing protein [Alteromonas facilis]|uniref:DUF1439 domain-containing protein n=1 Tax=Alteromonas facilis TaxID=2048004 RepID=UPI000C292F4F|nr:DUF1439 domain-containing protein [Alteromonas facilis]